MEVTEPWVTLHTILSVEYTLLHKILHVSVYTVKSEKRNSRRRQDILFSGSQALPLLWTQLRLGRFIKNTCHFSLFLPEFGSLSVMLQLSPETWKLIHMNSTCLNGGTNVVYFNMNKPSTFHWSKMAHACIKQQNLQCLKDKMITLHGWMQIYEVCNFYIVGQIYIP